jgi:Protein of unknown function (DUF3309)
LGPRTFVSSAASSESKAEYGFDRVSSLSSFDHQKTGGTPITEADSPGKKEPSMLGTILIVIVVLALIGALPRWSHSRDWGYAPTGGLGLVLVVVVVLLVLGRI